MKSKQSSDKNTTSSIDWEEINTRIKKAEVLVQKGRRLTSKEKQDLLRKRALELASEAKTKQHEETMLDVLTFRLAYEVYGVENQYVMESFHLRNFTSLPGSPDYLLGIVNFRGQIISITDLKKFFDLPDAGLSELNKVIILRNDNMEFGILADEITGIRKINKSELKDELPTLTEIRKDYLLGITKERLIVLDGDKILNDSNIIINDKKN